MTKAHLGGLVQIANDDWPPQGNVRQQRAAGMRVREDYISARQLRLEFKVLWASQRVNFWQYIPSNTLRRVFSKRQHIGWRSIAITSNQNRDVF